GHQKSAKPKAMPPGDRDFIAVPRGRSEERYPATQRQLYVTAYISETGAVVAEYKYDAFGNTITQSGSFSDTFRHRFSTKPWIAALGVYDYGERLYSPALRRWMSRDPIEEEGGLNLYAMCGNDAVNGVDPQGMFTVNAVNFSPRYSSKSDFWLGVYLDLLDDESNGYVKVYKKIKIDLIPCNRGRGTHKEKEVVTSIRVSQKQSSNKNLMYTINFPNGAASERVYVELASLGAYNNVCGTISLKFILGFSKRKSASEFGNEWTGENLFGSRDKQRSLSYYDFLGKPLTFLSSASFSGTLKYTCGSMSGPELVDMETSKNWQRPIVDRLGKGNATRTSTEVDENGAKSFPYEYE
ncbi:MAG: RHS repeat-associated core domain-containing protein, partial [Kiritimatiellae bacterium]|nr:RHS repeat-associated core domain-containing protein [Kiritimatiellia bacterium]